MFFIGMICEKLLFVVLFFNFIVGLRDGLWSVIIVFLLILLKVWFKLIVIVDLFFLVGVGLIVVIKIILLFFLFCKCLKILRDNLFL